MHFPLFSLLTRSARSFFSVFFSFPRASSLRPMHSTKYFPLLGTPAVLRAIPPPVFSFLSLLDSRTFSFLTSRNEASFFSVFSFSSTLSFRVSPHFHSTWACIEFIFLSRATFLILPPSALPDPFQHRDPGPFSGTTARFNRRSPYLLARHPFFRSGLLHDWFKYGLRSPL